MRTFFILLALLPGLAAAAVAAEAPKKKAPKAAVNPCAHYGANFVQVPGTSTCVKVSGSIQTDISGSGRAR